MLGMSLITISTRGWEQSAGLGCPYTGRQKPQEEDGKKIRRVDERENRETEKRGRGAEKKRRQQRS